MYNDSKRFLLSRITKRRRSIQRPLMIHGDKYLTAVIMVQLPFVFTDKISVVYYFTIIRNLNLSYYKMTLLGSGISNLKDKNDMKKVNVTSLSYVKKTAKKFKIQNSQR